MPSGTLPVGMGKMADKLITCFSAGLRGHLWSGNRFYGVNRSTICVQLPDISVPGYIACALFWHLPTPGSWERPIPTK